MEPKWIAVKERLPVEDVSVLVYDQNKKACYVGLHLRDRWWYSDHYVRWEGRMKKGDITHWMPLPDSPETVRAVGTGSGSVAEEQSGGGAEAGA